jgi:hypothetical protein
MSLGFIFFTFGAFIIVQSGNMGDFLGGSADTWLRIGILLFGLGSFALVNSRIDYLLNKNNLKS